jgi:arabinose operon protein AraL
VTQMPGLLLDIDGTVFVGTEWVSGARQALARLRRRGHPIVYVSNGLYWADDVATRLTDAGLPTSTDIIINTSPARRSTSSVSPA